MDSASHRMTRHKFSRMESDFRILGSQTTIREEFRQSTQKNKSILTRQMSKHNSAFKPNAINDTRFTRSYGKVIT
jgi:hypothetical protein